MPLALLLALAAAAQPAPAPPPRTCALIYPVAPNEAAARRIAEAVIAARPFPRRQRYVLRVMPDRDDPNHWVAFQILPEPRHPPPRGSVYVSAGGGGVEMRIDRCTGAVSRLHYSR